MPLPAQKFREMVFQMLYSYDFAHGEEGDMIDLMMHELKVTKKSATLAHQRMMSLLQKIEEIDQRIRQISNEYQFDRISRVEKNILRLGIYELSHDDSIPPKVAITEAIRLCRKFGTPESAHFVNAILDKVFKNPSLPGEFKECESKTDLSPVCT